MCFCLNTWPTQAIQSFVGIVTTLSQTQLVQKIIITTSRPDRHKVSSRHSLVSISLYWSNRIFKNWSSCRFQWLNSLFKFLLCFYGSAFSIFFLVVLMWEEWEQSEEDRCCRCGLLITSEDTGIPKEKKTPISFFSSLLHHHLFSWPDCSIVRIYYCSTELERTELDRVEGPSLRGFMMSHGRGSQAKWIDDFFHIPCYAFQSDYYLKIRKKKSKHVEWIRPEWLA